MNFRLSSQFFSQNLRNFVYRSLRTHQNATKCCALCNAFDQQSKLSFHTNGYNSQNKSQYNIFSKSRRNFLKTHASQTGILFQTRNLSTETSSLSNIPVNIQNPYMNNEFAKFISESSLVEFAQDYVVLVHTATGLPWWGSIILTTLIVRTFLILMFTATQHRIIAKVKNIHSEMEDTVKLYKQKANDAVKNLGWPEKLAREEYNESIQKEYNKLIQRDNCHPAKAFVLLLVQVPAFLSFTFAIRNLCFMLPSHDPAVQTAFMELSSESCMWVNSMLATDPYFVLPVTVAVLNLSIIEVTRIFKMHDETKKHRVVRYMLQTASILGGFAAAYMPFAVNIYWTTSSLYGLVQAFALQSPTVKRFYKIPLVETDVENPYRYFFQEVKKKFTFAKKEEKKIKI